MTLDFLILNLATAYAQGSPITSDIATATKWFLKINDAVDNLKDFPLCGPRVPESTFEEHFTDFVGLRQLVVKPYRVVYEATDTACNILGVMCASRLIGISNLGSV